MLVLSNDVTISVSQDSVGSSEVSSDTGPLQVIQGVLSSGRGDQKVILTLHEQEGDVVVIENISDVCGVALGEIQVIIGSQAQRLPGGTRIGSEFLLDGGHVEPNRGGSVPVTVVSVVLKVNSLGDAAFDDGSEQVGFLPISLSNVGSELVTIVVDLFRGLLVDNSDGVETITPTSRLVVGVEPTVLHGNTLELDAQLRVSEELNGQSQDKMSSVAFTLKVEILELQSGIQLEEPFQEVHEINTVS